MMAAGTLPKPGTEYGPCEAACDHVDCAETRRMAETVCHWCSAPIGYSTPFYDAPLGDTEQRALVHAECEEGAIKSTQGQLVFYRQTEPPPRVAVKASRPSLRGGWDCLLACGCSVHDPTAKRRPKAVDHVCPPESPEVLEC